MGRQVHPADTRLMIDEEVETDDDPVSELPTRCASLLPGSVPHDDSARGLGRHVTMCHSSSGGGGSANARASPLQQVGEQLYASPTPPDAKGGPPPSLREALDREDFEAAAKILYRLSHAARGQIHSNSDLAACFAGLVQWSAGNKDHVTLPAFRAAMDALKPVWASKLLIAGLAAGSDGGGKHTRDELWFASRLSLHVGFGTQLDQCLALTCKHLAEEPDAGLLDCEFVDALADKFPLLCATLLSKLQLATFQPFSVPDWAPDCRVSTLCDMPPCKEHGVPVPLDKRTVEKIEVESASIMFPAWKQAVQVVTHFKNGLPDGLKSWGTVGGTRAFQSMPWMLAMTSAGLAGFWPGVAAMFILTTFAQLVTWLFCLLFGAWRSRDPKAAAADAAAAAAGVGGARARSASDVVTSELDAFVGGLTASGTATLRLAVCRVVPIPGLVKLPASRLLGSLLDADAPVAVYGSPALRTYIAFHWHAFAKFFLFYQMIDHFTFMGLFITYSVSMAHRAGALTYGDATSFSLTTGAASSLAITDVEFRCMVLLALMCMFYLYQEVFQIYSLSLGWWRSLLDVDMFFGRIQIMSICLTCTVIGLHQHQKTAVDPWTLRVLCCIEILLLFTRLLHFWRAFGKLGNFVRMLIQVCKDLVIFLFVLTTVFCGFCTAYVVLVGPVTILSSNYTFLQQFTVIFGSFDYDFLYTSSHGMGPLHVTRILILLKALFQILVSIVLLNLLIAIINDSHEGVRMNEAWEVQRSKALLILQAEALLPAWWRKIMVNCLAHNMLCVIEVVQGSEGSGGGGGGHGAGKAHHTSSMKGLVDAVDSEPDGGEAWAGRIRELKKSIILQGVHMAAQVSELKRVVETQHAMLVAIKKSLDARPV